jgi:cellulose synthase/poly-beta-1,6-N-acetylglucosamine synthase-like glycosyltransferase
MAYTYLGYFFLAGYIIALVYVTIFCVMQFHLLLHFMSKSKPANKTNQGLFAELPFVTIQLPIFNEKYVVERLVDTVTAFDYPMDRMEIHILDDSTDDTLDISRAKKEQYQQLGYNISVITRKKRVGFKAGALKNGMKFAKGDFIAIFDADFLPSSSFLKDVLPSFNDKEVGVVQTRWDHINQDYSLLTQLQAFQLNVHFTIEQKGREKADFLLQFNGTAGVWRKETIESAGGWEADTLTEDLDLSYRAQLKGWKIKFLVEVLSPAELPAEIHGLKSQQHRWMKGGAETAKKLLPTIWSSHLPFRQKVHASTHLLSSSVFLFVFILGLFSVPLIFLLNNQSINMSYLSAFLVGLLSLIFVYYVANVQTAWHEGSKLKKLVKFLLIFPVFLSLSMGLSLHNSIAVLQGFRGKKSAFIRTPKYGIKSIRDTFTKTKYLDSRISGITIAEGLLALLFAGACIGGYIMGNYNFIIFHLLLAFGYGTTFYYSLKHLQR